MDELKPRKKFPYIPIGIVTLAVLALGAYFYFDMRRETETTAATATSTTITQNGVTITVPAGGDVKIEQVSDFDVSKLPPAPSLDRKVSYPVGYPENAKMLYEKKLADLKAQIRSTPYDANLWIELGILRKGIEDYEGARLAWEYAKALAPTHSVTYGNLGFLYGFHLKRFAEAEANFKEAIRLAPTMLYLYEQFFSFYRDVLQDKTSARKLAEAGIQAAGNKAFFDGLLKTL